MATAPEHVQEITGGQAQARWGRLREALVQVSPWLIVCTYAVVYTLLLGGAALAAISLAAMLEGPLGLIVFVFVGLGLVALAPTVARVLLLRTVAALRRTGET